MTGPSGASATPAVTTGVRGAAVAAGRRGAEVTIDEGAAVGKTRATGLLVGAGDEFGARDDAGDGRGGSRVSLSSWKKTMFTDTNPAGVSTKSS
jgi:hypothetical protein